MDALLPECLRTSTTFLMETIRRRAHTYVSFISGQMGGLYRTTYKVVLGKGHELHDVPRRLRPSVVFQHIPVTIECIHVLQKQEVGTSGVRNAHEEQRFSLAKRQGEKKVAHRRFCRISSTLNDHIWRGKSSFKKPWGRQEQQKQTLGLYPAKQKGTPVKEANACKGTRRIVHRNQHSRSNSRI